MSVSEMSFLRSENTQQDSNNSSASGNLDLQGSSVERPLHNYSQRTLLDPADKRLHTACLKQNVPFEWPQTATGRSCDEDDNQQLNRRTKLRQALLKSRRSSAKLAKTTAGKTVCSVPEESSLLDDSIEVTIEIDERPNDNVRRGVVEATVVCENPPCSQSIVVSVNSNCPRNNSQQLETFSSTPLFNFNSSFNEIQSIYKGRSSQTIFTGRQIVNEHFFEPRLDCFGRPKKQCPYCLAILWTGETSSLCCTNGKIKLDVFPEPPEFLHELCHGNQEISRVFRAHSRVINNQLALASQQVHEVIQRNGGWSPCVVIQGKVNYFVGPLLASPGETPVFAQTWVHDPHYEDEESFELDNIWLPRGTSNHTRNILRSIITRLRLLLQDINPYVKDFRTASEIPSNELGNCKLVINASAKPNHGHSRIYNRSLNEVSVIFNEEPGTRDFVLQVRGGGIRKLCDTHRSSDALHFVLLHPFGHDGWHLNLKQVNRSILDHNGIPTPSSHRITTREYYAFHLHSRSNTSNFIFRTSRLFQEYCCVEFAKCESQKLEWLRCNQGNIRAELYNNVFDAIYSIDSARGSIGRQIILPPSFMGSNRDMHRRFQDAMAIVRHFYKPDLFITMTCNPTWKEILEDLYEEQKPHDRPDIVARVFKMKLTELLKDLCKRNVLGKVIAHLYVVEFQKRGLPHAHILLILDQDSRIRTTQDVDDIVSAELPPDPQTFPVGTEMHEQATRLHNIVVKQMRHGPCGSQNPNAPCMLNKNGEKTSKCQKHYPKLFQKHTEWNDQDTYPKYRRRSPQHGGRAILTSCGALDNSWVVPYNPYLSTKYNAHINVEVCVSPLASKYLFKYVTKGADRVMMRIETGDSSDEIKEYQDRRSIGASEAVWRLMAFQISERAPAVYALRVHLENQQMMFFNSGEEERALSRDSSRKTELTEFFTFNRCNPNEKVSYLRFPEMHVWCRTSYKWKKRSRSFGTIGRILTVHPTAGEIFYLRMLLSHDFSGGAKSFNDLKTVNGKLLETYHDACMELGLLQHDSEWQKVLEEAAHTQMCPQIRELYVILLIFCTVGNPAILFESQHTNWWDDFQYQTNITSHEYLRTMVLMDIEKRLLTYGRTLLSFGLPTIDSNVRNAINLQLNQQDSDGHQEAFCEIREQLNFDREELSSYLDSRLIGPCALTQSQKSIFDIVISSVEEQDQNGLFFIDAPGGTGKSYLLNAIIAQVRLMTENSIVITVAASGIAATLLSNGRTFHSRFKAPIQVTETSTLGISKQSSTAKLIRLSKLIIWDEAPMNHRFLLEALDRSLRDILSSTLPFGGKPLILAGDFRQILPVVKRGSRAETVNAAINRSSLWKNFKCFELHENLRVLQCGNEQYLKDFNSWLLQVGDGTMKAIDGTDYILLPENNCLHLISDSSTTLKTGITRLIDFVYPKLNSFIGDCEWLAERAILAPVNKQVDEINKLCLALLPGELLVCDSADSVVEMDDATRFPVEYLNSLTASGIPPHRLVLKVGSPLMLLRNLNPKEGLCNGTRLILLSLHGQMLKCKIVTGTSLGRVVLLPRITFIPSDLEEYAVPWKRRQFPVRTAFAMTINKSQGQSLKRVGVYLEEPVFTHGQLYVASSRVGNPNNIMFAIKQYRDLPWNATRNVVYREVFDTNRPLLNVTDHVLPSDMDHSENATRPEIWYGFDMSCFPPRDIGDKTFSWIYMPLIFHALGKMCPSAWTFSNSSLPPQWNTWVQTYANAFLQDKEEVLKFIEENFDSDLKDHLNSEAQEHLIHDRYSQNFDVVLVSQELQEWALIQQAQSHNE